MKKTLRNILMAVFAIIGMSQSLEAQTLYGFSRDFPYAFVKMDVNNPSGIETVKTTDLSVTSGAFVGEKMYLFAFDDDYNTIFYSADITTGETTKIKNLGESAALPAELCYDYANEVMYYVTNSDNYEGVSAFGKVNVETGAMTKLTDHLNISVRGLAANAIGEIYAIGKDGNLYTINPSTYATTLVGATGVDPYLLQSLAFDCKTGILYWVAHTSEGNNILYTVNTTTGEATEVGKIGTSDKGLFTSAMDIPYVASAATAPNRVDNLTATADAEGQLSAVISWTNPATMTNGEQLASITKVEVLRGEEVIATLEGQTPGAEASYTDTPAEAGMYRYTVRAYNEVGPSADKFVDVWVGNDVAAAPVNIKALLASPTSNTITWEAPAVGAHGGYFNTEGMTYTVVRDNDNKTIASGLTALETEDSELLPELDRYTYSVYAVNNAGNGEAAQSNYLVAGPARSVPFTADFNGWDEAKLWTVVNLNEDESTFIWARYPITDKMEYIYQASETYYANDWLISCPIEFQEGHTYKITVTASNSFPPYSESFRVYSTSGYNTMGAVPLEEEFTINHPDEMRDYSVTLQAEDDGIGADDEKFISFIAVVCTSKYGMQMFRVGGVKVEDMTPNSVKGVENVDSDKPADNAVYTIDGRRIAEGQTLQKGIYIVNGKKVIK